MDAVNHLEITKKRLNDVMTHDQNYSLPVAKQQAMFLYGYLVAAADHGLITVEDRDPLEMNVSAWLGGHIRKERGKHA